MDALLQIASRIYLTNVLLVNSEYSPYSSSSLLECSRACVQNLTCASFFYNRQKHSCQLQKGRIRNNSTLTSFFDYHYYWLYPDYCLEEGYVFLRQAKLCVKVYTAEKTWNTGQEFCQNTGARLVILDTEVKYRAVVDDVTVDYPNTTFSIGLNYEDDAWKWTDGKLLTFASWATDEPSDYVYEYCANLIWDQNQHKLNDDGCLLCCYHGFICEIVIEF